MNELIDKLKEKYNYIIIDTPPIGLVTDAQILMNKSDINLIIIRQNYTTKKMVENIQDITSKNKIKNVSLIFNDVKNNKNSYAYNYGYGYYEEDYEKKTPWWKIN